MTTIQVRSFFNADVADLPGWVPESPAGTWLPLDLYISLNNAESTAIFTVIVVSPEALRAKWEEKCIWGRHLLVVKEYNWGGICRCLRDKVASCAAGTEKETIERLCRFFHWEYEDYADGKVSDAMSPRRRQSQQCSRCRAKRAATVRVGKRSGKRSGAKKERIG